MCVFFLKIILFLSVFAFIVLMKLEVSFIILNVIRNICEFTRCKKNVSLKHKYISQHNFILVTLHNEKWKLK